MTTPSQPTGALRPPVDPHYDERPLDAEILDRLVRVETRLCKLIAALGYEKLLTPKDRHESENQ